MPKLLLYTNAFVIGLVIMSMEMVGGRLLTPFFGSSIFTWASIISMVLLSLSLGYFIGGNLAEKKNSYTYLGKLIFLASMIILTIPLYFSPLYKWIYELVPNIQIGGFLGALSTLFVPLLLLGIFSPYAVKLALQDSDKSGEVSGKLYAISTLGSIIGTLGTTFLLIPTLGSDTIIYLLSGVTFISSSLLILAEKGKREIVTVFFSLYVILLCVIIFKSPLLSTMGLLPKVDKSIVEDIQSDYNNIIVRKKGNYTTMSFRRLDSKHIESKAHNTDKLELPLSYSQLMPAGLLYQTEPKSLLVIGLGGGTVSTYLGHYFDNLKIIGVELDDKVIDVSKKHFNLQESENFKVVNEDGRIFLSKAAGSYDLIMLDAYKGGYIPFHLCTKEYFALVKNHLNENGAVVLNLQRGSRLFKNILKTLESVFDNLDIYGSKTKGNAVVVAYDGKEKLGFELRDIAQLLQQQHGFRYDLQETVDLKIDVKIDDQNLVLTDNFAPINFMNAIAENNTYKNW